MSRIGKTTPAVPDNPNIIVDENTGQIVYVYDDSTVNTPVNPANPTNPVITPDSYPVIFDSALKNLPVHIKCTWANVFTRPLNNKGLCIRSYDRKILNGSDVIGTATGNYNIDAKDTVWIEVTLLKCDRRPTGWVNNDHVIAKAGKQVLPPPPVTPDIPTPPIGPGEVQDKSKSWMAWLTGAITLLSFFR